MIQPFTDFEAVAAALPVANVDTDTILPAAFLKTVSRRGLGGALFHGQRFHPDGRERADFVLNREPWRQAGILVTLDNFGCGSSREHAPWALLDFGIRCIFAPSFAEIFHANCVKNGILAATLRDSALSRLLSDATEPMTAKMRVSLYDGTIGLMDGTNLQFKIDDAVRGRLLAGDDDIDRSLRFAQQMAAHEARMPAETPWVCGIPQALA